MVKHVAYLLAFVALLVFASLCVWAVSWAALKVIRAFFASKVFRRLEASAPESSLRTAAKVLGFMNVASILWFLFLLRMAPLGVADSIHITVRQAAIEGIDPDLAGSFAGRLSGRVAGALYEIALMATLPLIATSLGWCLLVYRLLSRDHRHMASADLPAVSDA